MTAERTMVEEISGGMEVLGSSTNPTPASEPCTPGTELKPPIKLEEVKNGTAGDASSGIEATLPEAENKSQISHKVEYFHTGSRTTVYRTEGLSHEALLPKQCNDDSTKAILEVVDVNLTTENKGIWSREHLPLTYKKGCPYIKIWSPRIISALHHVVEYYPEQNWDCHELIIQAPYAIIWHHEDALEEYRRKIRPGAFAGCEAGHRCANENASEEIGTLLDLVRSKNGKDVANARELWAQGYFPAHMQWLFYKPGIEVYYDREKTGEWETYIIKSFTPIVFGKETVGFWYSLWKLSGDSETNTLHTTSTQMHQICPESVSKISKDGIIPCDYAERDEDVRIMRRTGKEIRKFFEKRGEMYCRLMRKGCFGYDGLIRTNAIRPYDGQVMVDPQQWAADNLNSTQTKGSSPDTHVRDAIPLYRICSCPKCEEVLGSGKKKAKFVSYYTFVPNATARQHFLCPGTTIAFLFKTRDWATLDVMSFKEPYFGDDILRNLVMPPETKSMIASLTKKYVRKLIAKSDEEEAKQKREADRTVQGISENGRPLTENHAEDAQRQALGSGLASASWSADFISGKGEGLIFLLHGKPGVGKTYTAECVAAHTERPLLSLTCTDIGTDPGTVEHKLQRWFKIAASWGAIMLIDEADIYMEHRQVQDLQRNNLVAGFLRALEYYQGILFLTTNRVGTFDEAFISRIHIMIHYPPFTDEDREAVWEGFFRKLEDEQSESMTIPESTRTYVGSDEVQSLNWNGREIRNAFQIAVALAQTEENKDRKGRIQIRREHIKPTVRMSKDFKGYLNKLYMKDETQRAAHAGHRLDSFGGAGNASGGSRLV